MVNFFEPLKSEFRKLHILIFELCRGIRLNGAKFIFSESSHFQIVFIPAFYYWMISCKKNNLYFIIVSSILFFLYLSNITTTAIIAVILISIYIFIIKFEKYQIFRCCKADFFSFLILTNLKKRRMEQTNKPSPMP